MAQENSSIAFKSDDHGPEVAANHLPIYVTAGNVDLEPKFLHASFAADRSGTPFPLRAKILGIDAEEEIECVLSSSLCDLCSKFIRGLLSEEILDSANSRWECTEHNTIRGLFKYYFHHYLSSQLLEESANRGCSLCTLIVHSADFVRNAQIILPGRKRWQSKSPMPERRWDDWFLPLDSRVDFQVGLDTNYELMLADDENDCLRLAMSNASDAHLSFPSPSSGSVDCFNKIRKWHAACTREHENCVRPKLSLPTRLLELDFRKNALAQIRLSDTKNLQCSGNHLSYVALSYCWGGDYPYKTTKANMEARFRGMILEEFPQVVQDAIHVCRSLDIRFLWVDAVCICQDDNEEWDLEATKMADIYGGSEFTISALSSSKATTGILQDRGFRSAVLGDAVSRSGRRQKSLKVFAFRRPRGISSEFERCPLSQRAWPLQERLLAPAVLHFGRDQLIWECETYGACSETGEQHKYPFIALRDFNACSGRAWHLVVQKFTGRKITYAKDRLPAIQGIAAKFRQEGLCCGRYVAGLWEMDLNTQLIWYKKTAKANRGKFLNEHISTWSWAHSSAEKCIYERGFPAFSKPPTYFFEDSNDERRSREGSTTVPSCAVLISGYIQKVSAKAFNWGGQDGIEWFLDHEPLPEASFFCLRALMQKFSATCGVLYLVIQKFRAGTGFFSPGYDGTLGEVYKRIGILRRPIVREEHIKEPYLGQDVYLSHCQPFLTGGRWEDIVLI